MKYRKKPVVIEAYCWNPNIKIEEGILKYEHSEKVPNWLELALVTGRVYFDIESQNWIIYTLEGQHICSLGDYIIKGVKGELYPCKPDIFALTYDTVTNEETPGENICASLVLSEVQKEMARQVTLWGEQNHNPHIYLGILMEEVGEATQAANDFYFEKPGKIASLREELIQTSAVAASMVECLDRGKWRY